VALGFGRNDQRGAATSKSRKDMSVSRNVHISISASWFVGELNCRRIGCRRLSLSASCPITIRISLNSAHTSCVEHTTAAMEEVRNEPAGVHITTLLFRNIDIGKFDLELNLSHELDDGIFA